MKKEELAHMLELAQDESTPEEVLTTLWYGTTSVKIRKAVASNPNASAAVLRTASRLYLEEVLENPGFQMIQMFDSDRWVGKVYEAYEDPHAFFVKYGKYQSVGINGDLYNRAILLSKNLTAEALNCCLAFGSKSALDRVLKNKSAFNNIQLIAKESIHCKQTYCCFDLESILMLYKVNVIGKEDLMHVLSTTGIASSSAKKRVYVDFFNRTIKEFLEAKSQEDKEYLIKLFARLVMVSRSHTMHWVDYWNMISSEKIDFVAKTLKIIQTVGGDKYLLSDHRRTFINVLCGYVRSKFNCSERTPGDFEQIYEFFNKYDLKEVVYEFGPVMNLRVQEWMKDISQCSFNAKEFFIRSKSFGTWATVLDSDDKYRIFDEVNNKIYDKHGISSKLLFNSCSVRKIVSIDGSTHIY